MIIYLKNKDTLILNEFKFKCCIGRKGITKNKYEGDFKTPLGKFKIGTLYWRNDRVKLPETKLICKKIKKNMVWCNDVNSKFYNKEINKKKNIRYEKLFRNDYKYDYFILIEYNYKNTQKNKGSAIFIHLTKNYKPTAGCIAISKKDFLILVRLIDNNSKILIN
tara:strand:+ start:1242 stop:1733 length:492 start_codon:yes stop_codon:yes gene_type:complete